VKLISWNVNGIRAVVNKIDVQEWLAAVSPDVLCLQETRALPEQVPQELREPPGYCAYWNAAERKGYSGVATLSKSEPAAVETGFGIDEYDVEGRALMTQFPGFKLFNVYFPNGGRKLERLEFKLSFYEAFLAHCDALHAQGERLIICGDYNTAHRPIDLARPERNAKTSGFLEEERAWIDVYLEHGFVDAWRTLNPEAEGQYTWWMYMRNARERNIGWRIDYFLVSEALMPAVVGADILSDVMGSDHCPIVLELDAEKLPF